MFGYAVRYRAEVESNMIGVRHLESPNGRALLFTLTALLLIEACYRYVTPTELPKSWTIEFVFTARFGCFAVILGLVGPTAMAFMIVELVSFILPPLSGYRTQGNTGRNKQVRGR